MTDNSMPWWQSRTIWAGIVGTIAPMVGLTDIGPTVDVVTNVVSAVAGIVAIYGRTVATKTVR